MIIGIGVDLVEIGRMKELLSKYSGNFEKRVFSEKECAYCDSMANSEQHYAARFCAKEAFLKALGAGLSQGISWQDVHVERLESGEPLLRAEGRAAEIMKEKGGNKVFLSLSHTKQYACASVVIEG